MEKAKVKKALKIVGDVLMYVFMAICILLVISSVSLKKSSNDAMTIFGYQARLIETPSMEMSENTPEQVKNYKIKDLEVNTLVFIETVPTNEAEAKAWFEKLQIGDVVTFRYVYNGQKTITHRIVDRAPTEGGYIFTIEGDNRTGDTSMPMQQIIDTSRHFDSTEFNYLIGKVTGESYLLGLLIFAMKTPVGMFCIIILPCLIIIVMEIIKIVNAFSEEKHQKQKEEADKKEAQNAAEIDRLKEQLAMLQANVMQSSAPATAPPTETEAVVETPVEETEETMVTMETAATETETEAEAEA